MKILKYLLLIYRKLNNGRINCRYYPSCSYYAEATIGRYGFFRGGFLALKRLISCNQWSAGGYDPVP